MEITITELGTPSESMRKPAKIIGGLLYLDYL